MEASFTTRHPGFKDALNVTIFVACVIIGTVFINSFVFRSFNVVGPSMENTLHTGDRLIVNRLPVTWAQLKNVDYIPKRGQIIVFKNPHFDSGIGDEYIVKRVIAFPGEKVSVIDGHLVVYNKEHPDGFNPDDSFNGEPGGTTSGDVNTTVPDGELFVVGDHREGNYSYDSRNGLGAIPFYDIVGPVKFRIYPLDSIRSFN